MTMATMGRVVFLILLLKTLVGVLVADDEITLKLYFIYLVTSNNSALEVNDVAFIENSSLYNIQDIIEKEKGEYESFAISDIKAMPHDRILENGFCIPIGHYEHCAVIEGAMTIKASGMIDDAIRRMYTLIEFVMNKGIVLLPFDGTLFYYKSTQQLSILAPTTNEQEISAKTAIMLPIIISVAAFLCTATIMFFLFYRATNKHSIQPPEVRGGEESDARLGIKSNDFGQAISWGTLKFPSSLSSISERDCLPHILTRSISSDCCSSLSALSIDVKDTSTTASENRH